VLVLLAAFAGYWWWRLNHNINVSALHGANAAPKVQQEIPDQFGRTPLNILIIGTDARLSSADASLGGDSGHQGLADVEMLVHIAADRSNATIMSIPRDTVTTIPACGQNPSRTDLINSALPEGTGCQVDTVETLTHVQINSFIMVDFNGVVQLTNAVGGVPICVNQAVNDPDSGLNLPAGNSTVQGTQALALLRTRHGFGDGSDIYRTEVQHMYLSSLIRKLKGQVNFFNVPNLLHMANVATSSLTVSPNLDSVLKLGSLAQTLKKVPSDRITFLTLPTEAYLPNPAHVTSDPAVDDQLFNMINNDQPLTNGVPAAPPKKAAPTVTPAAPSSVGKVAVDNGTDAHGRAGAVASYLQNDGFGSVTAGDYSSDTVSQTVVYYASGQQAAGLAVAKAFGIPAAQVKAGSTGGADAELVIGSDFTSGSTYKPSSSGTPGSNVLPSSVSSQAAVENAAATNVCAHAYGTGLGF
jgi:LCP family protein required for cell wall assembly